MATYRPSSSFSITTVNSYSCIIPPPLYIIVHRLPNSEFCILILSCPWLMAGEVDSSSRRGAGMTAPQSENLHCNVFRNHSTTFCLYAGVLFQLPIPCLPPGTV